MLFVYNLNSLGNLEEGGRNRNALFSFVLAMILSAY